MRSVTRRLSIIEIILILPSLATPKITVPSAITLWVRHTIKYYLLEIILYYLLIKIRVSY